MQGSNYTIVQMFDGDDKQFIIPVYQRKYSWKLENCRQLFRDLLDVVREQRRSHFFGSIVVAATESMSTYSIIDGQQRLTTVSLLLMAMSDLVRQGKLTSQESYLADQISDKLKSRYRAHPKLRLTEEDSPAYENLFSAEREQKYEGTKLWTNYQFFANSLLNMDVSVDDLYQAIGKLEVINIVLGERDNAQLIFESLNSTGLKLTESDKICNFILMNMELREQTKCYKTYWKKILDVTGNEADSFVRDYLSVKTLNTPKIGNIYQPFKEYAADKPMEGLLSDMTVYVKRYDKLLHANTGNKDLDKTITRLNYLGTDVTRPFLLEVLRLNEEGTLSMDETEKIFDLIESYIFRRAACSLPTNGLNKIFLRLHNEIKNLDGPENLYFEKFKYILLQKQLRSDQFPKDEEFIRLFSTRDMYSTNRCAYALERFETYGTVEVADDILKRIEDKTFTIEHIMPQTLSSEWKNDLGPDYERVHEEWINRIGNLTLTGYNSKMSNLSFSLKKGIEHGFNDSRFQMNRFVAEKDKWGESEIKQRTDILMDEAVKIWRYPKTSYAPEQKYLESFSLSDEDIDPTGRKIVKFSLHDCEEPVSEWIGMYKGVLQILYSQDPSGLNDIAMRPEEYPDLTQYFTFNKEILRVSDKLSDTLYFERNLSNPQKLSILRRVFKLYGEDPENLVFYLAE